MQLPTAFRAFSVALALIGLFAIASLSGAAGRLFGLMDWAGAAGVSLMAAVLVAAGLLFIKRVKLAPRTKWGIIIAYLTFVCGVAAFSAYDSYPAFELENLAIDVKVHDAEGKTGTVETRVGLKFVKGGVREVIWGGPVATGFINNVEVRRLSGDFKTKVTEQGGKWQFSLLFDKPPAKGERAEFAFTFDVSGSEPEEQIYWEHYVTWPTHNLQITLHAPGARPCKSGGAFSDEIDVTQTAPSAETGAKPRDESLPTLSHDNTELTWAQRNPEKGRRYLVVCKQ